MTIANALLYAYMSSSIRVLLAIYAAAADFNLHPVRTLARIHAFHLRRANEATKTNTHAYNVASIPSPLIVRTL